MEAMAGSLGNVSIVHQDDEVAIFLVQNRAFKHEAQPAPKIVTVYKAPANQVHVNTPLVQTIDPVQTEKLQTVSKNEVNSTGPNSPVFIRFEIFGISIAWRHAISCDVNNGTAVHFYGPYLVTI
jgi:hypothetical protein